MGAFAGLTLGCRSSTDLVRAEMELFISSSSEWYCGLGFAKLAVTWEGIPSMSWKVGCVYSAMNEERRFAKCRGSEAIRV